MERVTRPWSSTPNTQLRLRSVVRSMSELDGLGSATVILFLILKFYCII